MSGFKVRSDLKSTGPYESEQIWHLTDISTGTMAEKTQLPLR